MSLLLALLVGAAHACSCGGFWTTTADRCAGSERVFAGTVAGYDWPALYELDWRPVGVRLEVDTVWTGAVPAEVTARTGFGGGHCGLSPAPGTRFLVCDDGVGGAPPSFGFCAPPAFGEYAETVAAGLGAGGPPALVTPRLPGLRDVEATLSSLLGRGALLVPVLPTLFAAGVARVLRSRRPLPAAPARPLRFVLGVGSVALAVLLARLAWGSRDWDWDDLPLRIGAPLILAGVVGAIAGWRGQRRPGRWRDGATALVATGFAVAAIVYAGFVLLHLPVQPPGVVECSDTRAKAFLASLPPKPEWVQGESDRSWEGIKAWKEAVEATEPPSGCADWGLSRMIVRVQDFDEPCVAFPDGVGGRYARCAGQDYLYHSYEWPW